MQWIHAKSLSDISPEDLYMILKLRQDIFIIEQQCNYEDIDNIDLHSEHVFLKSNNKLIAYSRIVPAGIKFEFPSIGRIIVSKKYRGKGFGKDIVTKSLEILLQKGTEKVFIEAQHHLQEFYESLGFIKMSSPYPVDGIQHIKMYKDIRSGI